MKGALHSMQHRGPEYSKEWCSENGKVVFGHCRLSIIDLSQRSAQPFSYNDRYTIIYNGELYNYIELKRELQQKGYNFQTESDTEVVIASYAAWGSDCLQRFDGMFAFAIWDEREQILFAARDRFGEKPFFFYYDEEQLAFASEMKALWSMGIEKQVNSRMLYNFLTIGYSCNPSDPKETFYDNILKLPAASFLIYSLQKNELTIEKYWQPSIEIDNNITESQAIEKFSDLFSQSIHKRLRSDVAIGTSLSGGLDSSSVVAFCDKEGAAHYTHKCFTAVFDGFEKNEQQYAEKVASQYGLEHHLITIKEDELVSLMEKVSAHQEEPFSSASVLAQYKVFEAAKQNGVTVLLDGQGADEILSGYNKYYRWYWQELYREKKLDSSKEMEAARELSVTEPFNMEHKIAALFPEFTTSLLQSRKGREAYRQRDLNKEFAFSNKHSLYYSTPTKFDLNGALYYNTFVNGLEELLRLADRNSMAHSLEVRLPFLQHQLVEFLFTLPPQFKIHNGWSKWLLRKATENKLPSEIVWRKDKVGFEPPQRQWMQNKQVQEAIHEAKKKLVNENLLDSSVLNKPVVAKDAHATRSFDWRYWSVAEMFRTS